jgi:hypothetical protein
MFRTQSTSIATQQHAVLNDNSYATLWFGHESIFYENRVYQVTVEVEGVLFLFNAAD